MCGNPKREAYHQEIFGHRRHLYSAALLIFMRRTPEPLEPLEPLEPAEPAEPTEPRSRAIKGRNAFPLFFYR